MAFEYAIVLTGGIATGKSTVSKIFAEYGFEIIDADEIAHRVLD
ncbi:MAG: dephospho-CoA kinase, partial [Sulfurovum sp.]